MCLMVGSTITAVPSGHHKPDESGIDQKCGEGQANGLLTKVTSLILVLFNNLVHIRWSKYFSNVISAMLGIAQ